MEPRVEPQSQPEEPQVQSIQPSLPDQPQPHESAPVVPTPEAVIPDPRHRKLRHKKRLLIILIAILIALAAGVTVWYVISRANQPKAEPAREVVNDATDYDNAAYTTETTVTIENNSFSPSTVLVKPNTRVNVENTDGTSHWLTLNDSSQKDGPATSDQNNPDLANREEIVSGGGYAHVFEKPDTYVFHLTDNPTSNLTIIVQQ